MPIPPNAIPPYTNAETAEAQRIEQRLTPITSPILPRTERSEDETNFRSSEVREIVLKLRPLTPKPKAESAPVATHEAIVKEIHEGIAYVSIKTPEGVQPYNVSIDGMLQAGSGPVSVGDEYVLSIRRIDGAYVPKFTKKLRSASIQFAETVAEPDDEYIQYKLRQLKGLDDASA
jgi:hypothetical protein